MKRKEEVRQCLWRCPICNKQCGGTKGHKGLHQCSIHYYYLQKIINQYQGGEPI